MDAGMIEVRDLVKTFGRTRALKGINFSVPKGQIVGFLGPNGAGKTTTMRILTSFLRATAGEALIEGRHVDQDPLFTRSRVGYLPENAPLYDEMMVLEFLEFVADVRDLKGERRRARLREMVDVCGLGDVISRDIGQLSKGFRQRVGLAQAMIHDPDVLLLDEPTSGLDPNQIAEVRDLIRQLGQEKTLMLSTHILPEVQATCDRVIIISGGELVADDTVEGLVEDGSGGRYRLLVAPRNGEPLDREAVAATFDGVEAVRRVVADEGEEEGTVALAVRAEPGRDARRDLFEAAVAGNLVLLELHREAVSLEETFRKLTAGGGGDHA